MESLRVTKGVLPGLFVVAQASSSHASSSSAPVSPKYVLEAPFGSSSNSSSNSSSSSSSTASRFKQKPEESAFDEKCVCFYGYFRESVPESATETWRQRNLVLKFFLGDSTLDVTDPETAYTKNDGIVHGKFLRRTVVSGLDRSNFVDVLRIGSTIDVFKRVIYIYGCDEATRTFFAEVGAPQTENQEPPKDIYTEKKSRELDSSSSWHGTRTSTITRFLEASLGCSRDLKKDTKTRFIKYDGVKLRFLLLWKYRDGTKEEAFKYWLTYYLANEDCEIQEMKGQRSYRTLLTLLRRQRLPKTIMPHDNRARSCEDDAGDEDYYNELDFAVGQVLFVYGRNMQILDCDDFTQAFYLKEFGYDQRGGLPGAHESSEAQEAALFKDAESLAPVEEELDEWGRPISRRIEPLIPIRRTEREPKNLTGRVCSWLAKLNTKDEIDCTREFLLWFYADKREVAVYERSLRNDGMKGGAFLRRIKLKNPSTKLPYSREDFHIGSDIIINHFSFRVVKQVSEAIAGPSGITSILGQTAAALPVEEE